MEGGNKRKRGQSAKADSSSETATEKKKPKYAEEAPSIADKKQEIEEEQEEEEERHLSDPAAMQCESQSQEGSQLGEGFVAPPTSPHSEDSQQSQDHPLLAPPLPSPARRTHTPLTPQNSSANLIHLQGSRKGRAPDPTNQLLAATRDALTTTEDKKGQHHKEERKEGKCKHHEIVLQLFTRSTNFICLRATQIFLFTCYANIYVLLPLQNMLRSRLSLLDSFIAH